MKHMHIRYAALLLFALLSASVSSFAQTVLEQKISAISAIKEIRPLETSEFSEKYVTYFTQPLDHRHPEKGSFRQRVIVSHVGFDRPTVIVTEGYGAAYALRSQYREELSKLLNANMIFVEYRYFLESTPEPKDWQYLTAENSADDLHAITTAFKNIYPGKWIATGISKGGQTTLLYRTFYPDDVDISVPYVAPLCYGVEDGRHEPFLHKVSTPENRKIIEDFQLEALKRKATLLPRFEKYCTEKIIHSVHRLKKFTITRYWNILSLCGSGVLLSAPYPLLQPLMMKFSLICLPSANRDISPPTVPMLLSSYKLPVNWDTMVMTSNRSNNISPSSPVKAICTV